MEKTAEKLKVNESLLKTVLCSATLWGLLAHEMCIRDSTTTLSSGMVTTKISAAREFTVKAMTMAPITTNGLRLSLIHIYTINRTRWEGVLRAD